MASLQTRHTRKCASGRPWTTFAEREKDCSCKPSFHILIRKPRSNRSTRIFVGHDPERARLALAQVEADRDAEQQRRLDRAAGRKERRGTPSTGRAYSDLRLLIEMVDALIPGAQPWAKPNLKQALSDLYRAEDGLTRALKEGGV